MGASDFYALVLTVTLNRSPVIKSFHLSVDGETNAPRRTAVLSSVRRSPLRRRRRACILDPRWWLRTQGSSQSSMSRGLANASRAPPFPLTNPIGMLLPSHFLPITSKSTKIVWLPPLLDAEVSPSR